MQAAAGFDEIGTKPVTPKSMAPPWIDPPHGSIRQFTAACPCTRTRVPAMCVCVCVRMHQSAGPIGPLGAMRSQRDWYCAP